MKAKHAHRLRQGIIFYELCQENLLLIEHARIVLTSTGYLAWLRLMLRDGNTLVTGMPVI